jgi:UDP-N-acetylmuramyl pentapeptide phosphotransferase/UDP-N-acetylglucosamine-1-phosphate transferase
MQNATPEQLAEIKKAELDFEAQMKKMDVDIFALETADVQDARKAHKGDWTPRVFGLFSLCGFLGYIFLVTIQPPDANSDTIVSLVLGYLGGLVSGISSFYFGASHAKDD